MPTSTTIATIGTPANPSTAGQTPTLFEGGVAVALLYFVLKEAIEFFKKKDDAEGALTQSLIDDLRKERKEDLFNMSQIMLKIDGSNQQIAIAIHDMSKAVQDLNISTQQNARIHSEIFGLLREQERALHRIETYISDREGAKKAAV